MLRAALGEHIGAALEDAFPFAAKWMVIIIGRFEGGKLAEDWVEYDRYNLFRQLGGVMTRAHG